MPDRQDLPQRVSPLLPSDGEFIIDYKNVRLAERKALTAIQVLAFNGKHPDVAAAIGSAVNGAISRSSRSRASSASATRKCSSPRSNAGSSVPV